MSRPRKPHIETIDLGRRVALVTERSIDEGNFDALHEELAEAFRVPAEHVHFSPPVDGLVTATGDGHPIETAEAEGEP